MNFNNSILFNFSSVNLNFAASNLLVDGCKQTETITTLLLLPQLAAGNSVIVDRGVKHMALWRLGGLIKSQ